MAREIDCPADLRIKFRHSDLNKNKETTAITCQAAGNRLASPAGGP